MSRQKGRKWTPEELSLLRRLANRTPLSAIVRALDRSVLAIRTKAAHERLPLQDDLLDSDRCARPAMARLSESLTALGDTLEPRPGDYVVLYEARTSQGHPRLAIVCVSKKPEHTLIRATFSPAEEAGPRFEEQACRMAAAIGTRGFRCVAGRYTLLGGPTSRTHDA